MHNFILCWIYHRKGFDPQDRVFINANNYDFFNSQLVFCTRKCPDKILIRIWY